MVFSIWGIIWGHLIKEAKGSLYLLLSAKRQTPHPWMNSRREQGYHDLKLFDLTRDFLKRKESFNPWVVHVNEPTGKIVYQKGLCGFFSLFFVSLKLAYLLVDGNLPVVFFETFVGKNKVRTSLVAKIGYVILVGRYVSGCFCYKDSVYHFLMPGIPLQPVPTIKVPMCLGFVIDTLLPPKIHMSPKKGAILKGNESSSNHQCSGWYSLVFRGVHSKMITNHVGFTDTCQIHEAGEDGASAPTGTLSSVDIRPSDVGKSPGKKNNNKPIHKALILCYNLVPEKY